MGRLDFWNIPDELNRYEIAVHTTCEAIEPTGEEREDLRAAWMTAHLIASQSAKPLTENEVEKLLNELLGYIACNRRRTTISANPNLQTQIDEALP